MDEAYKNGMKGLDRHFINHARVQSYPVLPEITSISKYFYTFRNFEVRYDGRFVNPVDVLDEF